MGIVDGAVQRVHQPSPIGGSAVDSAFLAHDGVIGESGSDRGDNLGFGGDIGVRDEVGRTFFVDRAQLPEPGAQHLAAAIGGANGRSLQQFKVHIASHYIGLAVHVNRNTLW